MVFLGHSGLSDDCVRPDESFPAGPCSTCGGEYSLRYDLGPPPTATATPFVLAFLNNRVRYETSGNPYVIQS
jgi:hypothetical protein